MQKNFIVGIGVLVLLVLFVGTLLFIYNADRPKIANFVFPSIPAAKGTGFEQKTVNFDTGLKTGADTSYLVYAGGRALPFTEYILDSAAKPESGGVAFAYNVSSHSDVTTGNLIITVTGVNFDTALLPELSIKVHVLQ